MAANSAPPSNKVGVSGFFLKFSSNACMHKLVEHYFSAIQGMSMATKEWLALTPPDPHHYSSPAIKWSERKVFR